MEDAYVIGIRLALENGVSAGIAAIAADLHTLDAAIALTTSNLERLQTLARSSDVPRPPVRTPRDTASSAHESAAANGPILTTPAPSAVPERPASPPDTGRAGTAPAATTALAPPDVVVAPPTAPAIRILTPPSPTLSLPSLAPTMPILSASGTIPPAPGASTATSDAPRPRDRPSRAEAASSAAPRPPAAPGAPSPPPPLSHAPAQAAASARSASVTPAEPDATRGPAAPKTLILPRTVEQRPPAPASPAYPTTPAAPPAREAQSGAIQGDVYLDGTRLGRWMSDRLAREAGRPQSGATGFDPRLGPAWPGPLQGG